MSTAILCTSRLAVLQMALTSELPDALLSSRVLVGLIRHLLRRRDTAQLLGGSLRLAGARLPDAVRPRLVAALRPLVVDRVTTLVTMNTTPGMMLTVALVTSLLKDLKITVEMVEIADAFWER